MKSLILILPVYNEEKLLEDNVKKIHDYLEKNINHDWKIIIANNGSTDRTKIIAEKLSEIFPKIKLISLNVKGRGNALKYAWTKYDADALGYCDVDLATSIQFLKPMFQEIFDGNDIVIGNRYMKDSENKRTINRLLYSIIFNFIVRVLFKTKITDFQCGFKAISKKTANELIKDINDKEWFFDTELLLKAANSNYKIKQIPVKWTEMRVNESKVDIFKNSCTILNNLISLKNEMKTGSKETKS